MISLAAIKYRNILVENGGPISNLSCVEKEIRKGEMGYEACSFIDENIVKIPPKNILHGAPHGTGNALKLNKAKHKAISEAMERWAYFTILQDDPKPYGFDLDPSTSGLGAFPGLFKSSARSIAFHEAVERWAIREWWMGKLWIQQFDYKKHLGINALEISVPFPNIKVALVYRKSGSFGFYSYGFAAHKTLEQAAKKAEIEEQRNYCTLNKLFEEKKTHHDEGLGINEKRLLYFSSTGGHERFLQVARRSTALLRAELPNTPEILTDRELKGPWSKYATVWRVLFKLSGNYYYKDDLDFFCF